jgi:hypothetical protein
MPKDVAQVVPALLAGGGEHECAVLLREQQSTIDGQYLQEARGQAWKAHTEGSEAEAEPQGHASGGKAEKKREGAGNRKVVHAHWA